MNFIELLKSKYIKIIMQNDPRFVLTREEQEHILAKYGHPKDLIERSYFQYTAQEKLIGNKVYLYNIVAPLLIVCKMIFVPKKANFKMKYNLLCHLSNVKEDMIPMGLKKKYERVGIYYVDGSEHIDMPDMKWFYKNIFLRYPFSFFFQLKIMSRLCIYSHIIKTYNPDAIANHFEYSCTSSAMTHYCHYRGVKHINFMHGEKIWSIRDSFFKFDECYVWNNHYSKMFINLKAGKMQFLEELPPKFNKDKSLCGSNNELIKTDYCYYLANESHQRLYIIMQELKRIKNNGYSCKVRIHPNWGDHKYIKLLAKKNNIDVEEDGVDITDSIMSTKNAISLFSTVLLQSQILGKGVVIDDVSSPILFNRLKKLDYIAFSFQYKLLSDI